MKSGKVGPSQGEESSSSFPTPKPQELLILGLKIQKKDMGYIKEVIEINPRILCNGSDGPTILQEGARYNALHIAARTGNMEVAALVLAVISNPEFMTKIYPDDAEAIRKDRTKYLCDLYLNTPDKGALETPLHFACKFSWYDVVKLLLSHPLCDETVLNLDNLTPEAVIGTRVKNKIMSAKIHELFRNNRIVPIWRHPTNQVPAVVGNMVDPRRLGTHTPSVFHFKFPGIDLDLYGPVDASVIPSGYSGVTIEIKGYAGPMTAETALLFINFMRQSNRGVSNNGLKKSPGTPQPSPSKVFANLNISSDNPPTPPPDPQALAQISAPTSTKKPSLSKDSLFSTPPRSSPNPRAAQERSIRRSDPDKGLERVGRKYAKELGTTFVEYWKFEDGFLDLGSSEGLTKLENRLYDTEKSIGDKLKASVLSPVSNICRALKDFHLGSGNSPIKPVNSLVNDWRRGLQRMRCYSYPTNSTPSPQSSSRVNGLTLDKSNCNLSSLDNLLNSKIINSPNPVFGGNTCNNSDHCVNDNLDCSCGIIPETWKLDWADSDEEDEDGVSFRNGEEMFQECNTFNVYLYGSEMTREDLQVQAAITPIVEELGETRYPALLRWYHCLLALGPTHPIKSSVSSEEDG